MYRCRLAKKHQKSVAQLILRWQVRDIPPSWTYHSRVGLTGTNIGVLIQASKSIKIASERIESCQSQLMYQYNIYIVHTVRYVHQQVRLESLNGDMETVNGESRPFHR